MIIKTGQVSILASEPFCFAKEKNLRSELKGKFGYGDVWTWTAICADTKLVPSWFVGYRTAEHAYTPAMCIGAERHAVTGEPDPQHISTSFAERNNLTIRMSMRRFTRLTNAHSKKVENLEHALALHFMHYNFARIHSTLRVTPAMEAGVANHVWELGEIVELADSN